MITAPITINIKISFETSNCNLHSVVALSICKYIINFNYGTTSWDVI